MWVCLMSDEEEIVMLGVCVYVCQPCSLRRLSLSPLLVVCVGV